MVISVGYRVKSKNGIIFRKWANGVLNTIFIPNVEVFKGLFQYKLITRIEKSEEPLNIYINGFTNDKEKEKPKVKTK